MAVGIAAAILISLSFTSQILAQGASVRQRITQAIDERQTTTLRGNVHPMAKAEFDHGAAPADLAMNRMQLLLQRSPEQERALQQLMEQQQTKGSANYQKWLTPAQFGEQFGPSDADIQTVTGWLSSHGFQVTKVAAGKTMIEFSGTAGQVRNAFHTEIHRFVVNGEEHWANSSDPQIPAALTPVVSGVHSLHNFFRKPLVQKFGYFQKSKKDGTVTPLFTFIPNGGQPLNALGPTDFATIYNVTPLWNAGIDGTGQQIAIVGETNINCQDVLDFRSHFNLPATITGFNAPIQCNGKNWTVNLVLNGPDPGVTNEETEADLDVQWSGAIAKNAVIDFVISESTETEQGVDLSALYIVDNNLAPVLSESFGACEAALGNAGNQFYSSLWEQAASQGISVLISSGDSGAAGCDNPNAAAPVGSSSFGAGVNGIASTPFDVAVGGTDFDVSVANYQATFWNSTNDPNTADSAKMYVPETTWNDSCAQKGLQGCATDHGSDVIEVGGGGGPSNCAFLDAANQFCQSGYTKPTWQTGTGVQNDGVRDTPDLALFAADGFVSGSFYIVCQSDQDPNGASAGCNLSAPFTDFIGVGGTSSSAPAFAGMMAMVNQNMGKLGKSMAQGNANFVLYPMAAQAGASCSSSSETTGAGAGCIFNDVTKGNNSVPCVGGSFNCNNTNNGSASFGVLVDSNYSQAVGSPAYNATTGYDMATGLGSVNAANLVNTWPTITFNPTSTTLAITPTTITHGQTVNVTIGVTSGSGTPTGDVSLIGKPAPGGQLGIDGFTLTNGTISSTSTFLVGGTYPINAHYGGDGKFGASDSTPPISVTVNPETSATTVSLLYVDFNGGIHNAATTPFGMLYGAFNLIRIDVAPTGQPNCSSTSESCATGNVTLSDNGQPFQPAIFTNGQLKLNSLGYAEAQTTLQGAGSVTIPALSVGAHSFVANYPGDPSFNASMSSAAAIAVAQAPTTVTFNSVPPNVQSGAAFTLNLAIDTQVAGSNPPAGSYGNAPTGMVTFFNGNTQIGTSNLTASTDANGFVDATALLTTSLTATASIKAVYSGDANYLASNATTAAINVPSTGPGFTLTPANPSLTIAVPGQAVNTNITVAATGGFTGNVALTCTVAPANQTDTPGCALNPASVGLTAQTTSTTSLLTITTTAASNGVALPAHRHAPPSGGMRLGPIGEIAMLLSSVLFAIALIKKRRTIAWIAAPMLIAGAIAAGCGGGGSSSGGSLASNNPGTTPAIYTITITGTSGNTTQSTSVSVNVQ